MKQFINRVIQYIYRKSITKYFLLIYAKIRNMGKKRSDSVTCFDPSLGSSNQGDFIIMEYCRKIFQEAGTEISEFSVATHYSPTAAEQKQMRKFKNKILCGTNILEGTMGQPWLWQLPKVLVGYDNLILLGAGWNRYGNEPDWYTKKFYSYVLDKNAVHSVRDEYTSEMLRSIGIKNVINTACPSMWGLTKEICEKIPTKKASQVITTLTDYDRDPDLDYYLLELLSRKYEKVFIWLQGACDEEYFKELKMPNGNYELLSTPLEGYDKILTDVKDLDYVGTRLHGGVRALNFMKRTIIIAVDNRAIEISRDTNLCVIPRKDIKEKLETVIDSDLVTDIKLPQEAIDLWKSQFSNQ